MNSTECIRRAHTVWTTCRCDTCRKDLSRQRKKAYVGIYQRERVPSEYAWRILAAKIDDGWTAKALGTATGVRVDYFSRHIAHYRQGRRVHLGPTIAAAIIRMGHPTDGQVGITGTRRRLRALARIGYGLNDLAAITGIGFSTLGMARNSTNVRCSARVATAVRAAFQQLHMTPGHNAQAIAQATEKGWPAPMAFDDIDDPKENPTRAFTGDSLRSQTNRARREDLTWLTDSGATLTEALRRLDLSRDNLWKWCDRHGMRDAFDTLSARERVKDNGWTTPDGPQPSIRTPGPRGQAA